MALNTNLIYRQLLEIGSFIEQKDIITHEVSKASVGWHLAHIIKVFTNVCEAMKNSDPKEYKSSFSLKKKMVFFTGKIPRGKAKAPKSVLPAENLEVRELEQLLHDAKQQFYGFMELEKNANFYHPFFDKLNKKETLRFLEIHNEHHLKIVRDITRQKLD